METRVPRLIPMFNTGDYAHQVVKIAAGAGHALVLTKAGKIFSWGINDDGALGRESIQGTDCVPGEVNLPIRASHISVGDSHSIAYNLEAQQVYFWGVHRNSSSGIKNTQERLPIRVLDQYITAKQPLRKVVSGSNHALVLAGNKVFAWGDPESGKIGRNLDMVKDKDAKANEPSGIN